MHCERQKIPTRQAEIHSEVESGVQVDSSGVELEGVVCPPVEK